MGAVFTSVYGQSTPEPEREQLLNGLRVLFWHRPGDQDVLLKLRIHSGAAFDMAGKGGQMAIFGDILPEATTREYFTEEMGAGSTLTPTTIQMVTLVEYHRSLSIPSNHCAATQPMAPI
jgi:hypothetical protein